MSEEKLYSFGSKGSVAGNCGLASLSNCVLWSSVEAYVRVGGRYMSPEEHADRCKPLRAWLSGLLIPTVFSSRLNMPELQPLYIQEIVALCEEMDLSYVVLPSYNNPNYPTENRPVGTVIVYPPSTKLTDSNLCYANEPDLPNITYSYMKQ